MRHIAALFLLILCVNFHLHSQSDYTLNYKNSIKVINQNNDTLKMPFVGGLTAAQFMNIDLNGDGKKDLFVFDRQGGVVLTFLQTAGGLIYAPQYESMFPELSDWVKLIDYNCDGKLDILSNVDENASPDKSALTYNSGVRYLKNISSQANKLEFKQYTNQLFAKNQSQTLSNVYVNNSDYPVVEDVDNDGDVDVVTSIVGQLNLTYLANLAKQNNYCDTFNLITRDEAWGYVRYLGFANKFLLHDSTPYFRNYKHGAHNGIGMCMYDFDNDGDKDLLYGDVSYNSMVYLENGKTINSLGRDSIISQDTVFPKGTTSAYISTWPIGYVADIDGDGKPELIVTPNATDGAKNTKHVMLYSFGNTGPGGKLEFKYKQNDFLVKDMIDLGGGAFPSFADIDADGDMDLVVATNGDFNTTKNQQDQLVLYKNIGNNTSPIYQLQDANFLNISAGYSVIKDIAPSFGDLDGDGKVDLLFGDFTGNFRFYKNQSSGNTFSFVKQSDNYFKMNFGAYNTPQLVDFNKDGLLDIITGNQKGFIAYFQNKGTAQNPQFDSLPTIDTLGNIFVGNSYSVGGSTFYDNGYSAPSLVDMDADGNYEMLVGNNLGQLNVYSNVIPTKGSKAKKSTLKYLYNDAVSTTKSKMGNYIRPSSYKLPNDSFLMVAVGNARGGLRMFSGQKSKSSVKEIAQENNKVVLYPNPASNELFIDLKNRHFEGYKIYTLIGTEVLSGVFNKQNTQNINIQGLDNGIYFISMQGDDGKTESIKFVISK